MNISHRADWRSVDIRGAFRFASERLNRHRTLLVGTNAVYVLVAQLMNLGVWPHLDIWLSGALAFGTGIVANFILLNVQLEAATTDDVTWPSIRQRLNWRRFLHFVGVSLIVPLFVLAGLCAFVIPGVLLMLVFSQAWFLVVNRGLTCIEAYKESSRLTKGHKLPLFWFGMIGILLMVPSALTSATVAALYELFMSPLVSLAGIYVYLRLERAWETEQP